jgi:hypothetical protein
MKSFSMKKNAIYLAIICAALACVPSAHAVPANQLFQTFDEQVPTGLCCFSWNETVSVVEPSAVVPVVVTWSTDYILKSLVFIQTGLMVNDGPCQAFGPGRFEQPLSAENQFDTRMVQFIVEPARGLHVGTNTFTLCGGGLFSATDSIGLGANTLEVRLK